MKHALIENGAVANIVMWDGNTETWQPPEGQQAVAMPEDDSGITVGTPYADGQFAIEQPQTAPQVPQVVTMRQARLALLAGGHLAHVQDAIVALPSPDREAAQIEWDYAATVERQSAIVHMLAGKLALDDAALDALFTQAAAL